MKKGMMLLEEVMSILVTLVIITIVIVSFSLITSRLSQSKEESQAKSTLNSFYNFLLGLDSNKGKADNFIIYAPAGYYFLSYDKTAGRFTECYEKNCVCLCKDKDCKNDKTRFCQETKKPLKFNGKDIAPVQLGVLQMSIISEDSEYSVLSLITEKGIVKSMAISTKPGIEVDMHYTPLYSIERDKSKIDMIVLHHTEGTTASGAYETLVQRSPISVHYIIDRNGRIYYVVDEAREAFHAGEVNYRSIGIEIVGTGCSGSAKGYTDAQYSSIKALVEDIVGRWPNIKLDNDHIIGHFQTKQGQKDSKVDPSGFDWARIGLPDHPTSPESCPLIIASA